MKRTVLLNPGPINVTDRVRDAQLRGDLCHREMEFSDLMANIRRKLLQAFDVDSDYSAVLMSGSGTAALEMAVSSCLSPGRSMLVIQNGVYGDRIAKMADVYGFKKHGINYPWGTPPVLEDVELALKQNSDIEVVAMVHHETTTGLLNPLGEVSQLARRYGKKMVVDCISSLAGDTVDFKNWSIDIAVGTANKCVQGLPGVSFVLVKKDDLDRLEKIPARSIYLNLVGHHIAQEKGDTLFTPAIQAHYALDAALDELIEETVANRINRYHENARSLRQGFVKIGLKFMIPEHQRSNCLTSLYLPKGLTYTKLHDELKHAGFVIYAGQANLSDEIFRIANMGDIHKEEFEQFLESLETICAQHRG